MEIVKTKIQESDERHSVIRKQIEELDRMELEK